MKMCFLLLCLCYAQAFAANWYVRKDGDDDVNVGNADTAAGAWLTLGKAASSTSLQPGDTVFVRAGAYYENVNITRSGTQAMPIVWQGERSGESWLTIIDGTQAASSGWVAATEVGTGVFKHTSLPFRPSVLVGDAKLVTEWKNLDRGLPINVVTWLDPDSKPLAASTTAINTFSGSGYTGEFWDPVEAFWYWDTATSTAYVRFRDSSDANGHSIRIHNNGTVSAIRDFNVSAAPIRVTTGSWNVINGFEIRGAVWPVAIQPVGQITVAGITIVSNYVHTGNGCILAGNDGVQQYGTNSEITIAWNKLAHNWYAGDVFGSWAKNASWPEFGSYTWSKYHVSVAASELPALQLYELIGTNAVVGNMFTNCGTGLKSNNWNRRQSELVVASNIVTRVQEGLFVSCGNGLTRLYAHDNLVGDAHIPFRMHATNAERGFADQAIWYLYRNRAWIPPGNGNFVYYYKYANGSYPMQGWWYHNSFEGGSDATFSTSLTLPGWAFVNNIFNSRNKPWHGSVAITSPATIGAWDYNRYRFAETWTTTTNNIVNSNYEFGTGAGAPTSLPTFVLKDASPSLSKGVPVHVDFSPYSALPGFVGGVYYQGTQPDLGALQKDFGATNEIVNVVRLDGGSPFNVLADVDEDPEVEPSFILFSIHRDNVLVDGELVPNTFGDVVIHTVVTSPDGAVDGVDFTITQNTFTITNGFSAYLGHPGIEQKRNPLFTGQRKIYRAIIPDPDGATGGSYQVSGANSFEMIVMDAESPPNVLLRPQPEPGHGLLHTVP